MPDPADTGRFAAMYEQNRARVYAFAVSKAGRQLADEILSEVFMIAWRKFDAVPDPPLPWLLTVARNVAMTQFRATVREQSVAAEMRAWLSADDTTARDVAEDVADRIVALAALAELHEADRELLTLVATQEQHASLPSLASRLTRSGSTNKNRSVCHEERPEGRSSPAPP